MTITRNTGFVPEKKIKHILEEFLTAEGWRREGDEYESHDIDLEVRRGEEIWRIEIKSAASLTHEITDSFVAVLGQTLQRMDDKKYKYSIALPDAKPFRRLWKRLPRLAKERTGITALFVDESGAVEEIPG